MAGYPRVILVLLLQTAVLLLAAEGPRQTPPLDAVLLQRSTVVLSGVIAKRFDRWDRRPNRDMGRPDVLVEILLTVTPGKIYKGKFAPDPDGITVSVAGRDQIVASKSLREGETRTFYLAGKGRPFSLVGIEPAPSRALPQPVAPQVTAKRTNRAISLSADDPERIGGKQIRDSEELRKRVARQIADRYGMKDASVITLVSYSGPMPPDGGYFHWGVKGMIGGKWFVWQPGRNGRLHEGDSIDDPHKYQKCNSPGTMISTPSGPVPIKDLKPGDLVLSDGGRPAAILRTARVRAENHRVCRLVLGNGTVLEISPGHPLADGRPLRDLAAGDLIDGIRILSVELVPYGSGYTYDILPDSPTGCYFAGGIKMASTLR